uniref:Uncharacterized protein n=1 Tax=Panagrolaimus sp. PS1159 TaxID=55785 RepID=A0AC35F850_9BILA
MILFFITRGRSRWVERVFLFVVLFSRMTLPVSKHKIALPKNCAFFSSSFLLWVSFFYLRYAFIRNFYSVVFFLRVCAFFFFLYILDILYCLGKKPLY